jgi:hypothetical protein
LIFDTWGVLVNAESRPTPPDSLSPGESTEGGWAVFHTLVQKDAFFLGAFSSSLRQVSWDTTGMKLRIRTPSVSLQQ